MRVLLARGPRPTLSGESPWALADYAREVVASGFPGIRPLPAVLRQAQLDGYVQHLTTRDAREANGAAANPGAVARWLRACAAATATTTSLEKLRVVASGDGGASAQTTILRYRDGGLFGALFESLVALSMRTYAQAADAAHVYVRAHGGEHEVDGLLIRRDQRCVAYEVKLAAHVTDRDVRHLHGLRERLGSQLLDAVVVNTGPAAYRRADGVGVVPAAMLVP